MFKEILIKIKRRFFQPNRYAYDLNLLRMETNAWWKPEWNNIFGKVLTFCLMQNYPSENLLSNLFFFFLLNEGSVLVDIPDFNLDRLDLDKKGFLKLLEELEISYKTIRFKNLVKDKNSELYLLTIHCHTVDQLSKVLNHLFHKLYWFEFYLRCFDERITMAKLQEILKETKKRLESFSLEGNEKYALEELQGVIFSFNSLLACCVPFDRQDGIQLFSFHFSYEELRDKLASFSRQYHLRFKEGEIE